MSIKNDVVSFGKGFIGGNIVSFIAHFSFRAVGAMDKAGKLNTGMGGVLIVGLVFCIGFAATLVLKGAYIRTPVMRMNHTYLFGVGVGTGTWDWVQVLLHPITAT